ncbi:hypothetical protein RIR_jg12051.t1 [Rhizophagus irregularis DAOM 181602=DAOM 197198]|uniref:Bck1p n=2 Tax=Rhizophagus irregularis TaxID=588596 RepID=A0A015M0Q3_RHIIW|nr:Bck1p [Rhizophagus irregularis DAOM 197198w]GBC32654.1 hypothetical protein RIR_jg12051.t1 [Rhizophagus irregularis DAOM 181602=DAOM 197198]
MQYNIKTNIKCPECGQNYTNENFYYCKPCNSAHFHNNFAQWTSGDLSINKLIQNSQLNATFQYELIEWIEYSNLENVEFVAHGGFGSVYKAIWKDGPINTTSRAHPWEIKKSRWNRDNNKEVAIKKFRNATVSEFLDEIKNNLSLNFAAYCNVIYGVTCDPHDNKYAIVMKYQNLGNLRESIKKDHILNWRLIIKILHNISYGLSTIHRENYCHGDFQTSNILLENYGNYLGPVISDFGLCRPADQSSIVKTIYGVLPFIAPEVLRGIEFTKASDVYGFGFVMLEIICGNVPFSDKDYDIHLALKICKGERPPIPEYTPEPYAALIERCWDPIPTKRPTAQELYRQIGDWDTILSKLELNDKQIAIKLEIEKEFSQEREDRWKARLSELTINPHPLKHSQNFLTSKRLEYSKQLNQLLDKNDTTYTRQFDMSLCLPKLKTKEEFSQEREDRWKVLSKFINSHPLILANKRLEYSKKLNQLNDTTYYTRQFDMSLCLPKVLDNYV